MSGTRSDQSGSGAEGAAEAEPEIEIIDTPRETPAQAAQPARQARPRAEQYEHDDADEYSAKVNKRIAKMTGRIRSEESARLAAEQRSANLEAELLKERATRYGERETAITGDLTQAERELAAATESGDHAKAATASRRIAELAAEKGQVATGKSHADQQRAAAEQRAKALPQQVNQVSPAVQEWIDRGNDWFLTDEAMRLDAIGQHNVAVARKLAPDSKEYFDFIDTRMRALHPDKFDEAEPTGEETQQQQRQPAQEQRPASRPAAPAAQRRTVPGQNPPAATPRKIQLTREEMDVCEALRITPQQYANDKAALAAKGK